VCFWRRSKSFTDRDSGRCNWKRPQLRATFRARRAIDRFGKRLLLRAHPAGNEIHWKLWTFRGAGDAATLEAVGTLLGIAD